MHYLRNWMDMKSRNENYILYIQHEYEYFRLHYCTMEDIFLL